MSVTPYPPRVLVLAGRIYIYKKQTLEGKYGSFTVSGYHFYSDDIEHWLDAYLDANVTPVEARWRKLQDERDKETVEELLGLPNCIFILGNHDAYFRKWLITKEQDLFWETRNAGRSTLASYSKGVPSRHKDFFLNAPRYHVVDNMLFVHGGVDPLRSIHLQDPETLIWDRSLFSKALASPTDSKFGEWDLIFMGHNTTLNVGSDLPIKAGNVMMMDTGAGWDGKLSVANIDTHEVFQSDPVQSLYPGVKGRMSGVVLL